MSYLYQLIRNYPLSILMYVIVLYLSFFTPPKVNFGDIQFVDKWTHIVMYLGTCGVTWFEYLRRHKTITEKTKLFLLIWLVPVVFSGIIELLQEYCTGGRRSGDWLDLAANAIGVSLAAIIGLLAEKKLPK